MCFSKRILSVVVLFVMVPMAVFAGEREYKYSVLAPISSGNLTIYPVVSNVNRNTSAFLTLDEGVRSGSVVITESGQVAGLVRRPGQRPTHSGAEVNRLVLLNNSDRPLLLLAGEIVTGGKQDRVIGSDRIVPPHSDPVDLSVFCVEPGRWVARSDKFSSMGAQMAQPSVRLPAMAKKDQNAVWENVRTSQRNAVKAAPAASPMISTTSSYAGVMQNEEVGRKVESVAAPLRRDYSKLIRELKQQNAVGVVVAVDGQLVWADVFASTELLENYWPKLIRSYAAEAVTGLPYNGDANQMMAQRFINQLGGEREVTETEPGVFRSSEVDGPGYKVFFLASLLPKVEFVVHTAKMVDASKGGLSPIE